MAAEVWDGSSGSAAAGADPLTAANWTGSGDGLTNADEVYIAATNIPILAADQSAVTLDELRIFPGFGDNSQGVYIGGTGGLWEINSTVLEINNTRCSHIRLAGAFPTAHIRRIGGAQLYFGPTSDIGDMYCGDSGFVEVDTGAKLLSFTSDGMSARIWGDTSSPDDLSLYIPSGCVVECYRRIAFASVSGTLIMKGAAEGDISAGTSEIIVNSGGSLNVQSTGNIDMIVATARSVVTGLNTLGGSSKPTVATLKKSSRANVNLPSHLFTITSTVPIGDEYQGGPV